MTTSEAQRLIATLKAAYPRQEITPDTLTIYTEHLVKIPADLAMAGVKQHISESPFFPAVADILSRSRAIKRGHEADRPDRDEEELTRLTTEQLAQLKDWTTTLGGNMRDLTDEETPMPAEDWFAENEAELSRLADLDATKGAA